MNYLVLNNKITLNLIDQLITIGVPYFNRSVLISAN